MALTIVSRHRRLSSHARNSGNRLPDLLYRLFVFGFGGACVLVYLVGADRHRARDILHRRTDAEISAQGVLAALV